MAKFMLMLLTKGPHNGKTILKPETVAEMFKRSMVSEIGFSETAADQRDDRFLLWIGGG
jgi:hypothetical protein